MTFDEWWDIKASTINKALKNNCDYIKPFFENAYTWGKETGEKENKRYYDFYDSVACLIAEGSEFMTKAKLCDAIKKEHGKV